MSDSLPIPAAAPGARQAPIAARGDTGQAGARGGRDSDDGARAGGDFGAAFSEGQQRSTATAGDRQGSPEGPADRDGAPAATRDGADPTPPFIDVPARPAGTATGTEPGAERALRTDGAAVRPEAETAAVKAPSEAPGGAAPAATDAAARIVPDAGAVDAQTAADGSSGKLAPPQTSPVPAGGADPASTAVRSPSDVPAAVVLQAAAGRHASSATRDASTRPNPKQIGLPPPREGKAETRGEATTNGTVTASAATATTATSPSPPRGAVAPTAGPGAAAGAAVTEPGKGGSGAALSGAPDGEQFSLATGEGRETALRPAPAAAEAPRADAPRPAMAQIVEAVRLTRDGAVEVALHPEELGRVRLSLTTGDGTLHIQIQSDRPETADLLRRHVALLQEDLRALGYRDVSFAFGSGTGNAGSTGAQTGPETAEEPEPEAQTGLTVAAPALDAALRMAGGGGLDLRF